MTIENDARRLTQSALVAAIEGSYAMGFIELTVRTILRTGTRDIKALGKKLARRFIKHWWKHTTQRDLARMPRKAVGQGLRHRIDTTIQGAALRRRSTAFYAYVDGPRLVCI